MRTENSVSSKFEQAALGYTALGARVFPCQANKRPLTLRGFKDASNEPATIRGWGERFPFADVGLAVANSFVVVDIEHDGLGDFRGVDGRDALAVETPIASTPSGGFHQFYRTNGLQFRNGVRIAGLSIDVRAVGGYVIAPSESSGRQWIRPPLGPWESAPQWLIRETERNRTREHDGKVQGFSHALSEYSSAVGRYCRDTPNGAATLAGVCNDIRSAPCGQQRFTILRKGHKIGCLIAEGEIGPQSTDLVLEAALAMPNYKPRPWTRDEVVELVSVAIRHGVSESEKRKRGLGRTKCRESEAVILTALDFGGNPKNWRFPTGRFR
jgi:hypothetical protein